MNTATIMSISTATATLVVGTLCLALSRARGWTMLRWFAVASLSACAFSVTDVAFSLDGTPELVVVWAGRIGGAVAALHVAAWLPYVRERTGRPLRRSDWAVVGAAALLAPAYLVPGWVYPGGVVTHDVPWYGVTYHLPQTTWLAMPSYAVLLGMLLYSLIALWRMTPLHSQWGLARRLAILFFFGTAANEALVAAHLIDSPFLLELGFTFIIVGVGVEVTGKFLADARALAALTEQLDAQVRERTRELVHAEAELARSARLAALGQLAAGVGHEINNPLSYVMLNLVEIAKRAKGDPETSSLAEEALDGVERIRHIVTDLKVLARGPGDDESTADLGEVLQDARKLVRPGLASDVQLEVDTEALPSVRGSTSRLTQVFANLLGNAVEARKPDRPLTVRVDVRSDGDRVHVAVRDDGTGIPPEVLERVFEPFFTTKHQRGGGTGLGLAISRAIVTGFDGDLTVSSDEESGTTFTVTLLRASPAPIPAEVTPGAPPARTEPIEPCRILVIDDEPLVRRALCRVLRPHQIQEAGTGQEALSALLAPGDSYDAVICDLVLPDIGGAEVFARVCAERPDCEGRFLFLTGGAVDGPARELLSRDGIVWIQKPVRPEELLAEVARIAGVRS